MGMLDQNMKFSVAQAVTALGDTASTHTYDNGAPHAADIGLSDLLWINALVDTKATSGGAASVQAVLQHSDDNSTWVDAMMGTATPVASLNAGAILLQSKFPVGGKRYLRLVYRVTGAALTAGKFTAFASMDVQNNTVRPSGFTVK